MFRLEINDPSEARALISQNLVCQVTGIVYKMEEFRSPVSVKQCYNCQSFGHSDKTCRSKQTCLICVENHSHKECPNREARKPKCANCKWPHVASYKACPDQVISHQVTTGEEGKKYCKTLPAHFERDDSEFSGVVPIEKTNIDSLNLPCHEVYRSSKLECYIE